MQVTIGSNDFFGVPFPLVLADRFFNIYRDAARFNINVFRWDLETRTAAFEVRAGQPLMENIATNPTGIVTFSREGDGSFMYKFRPKPGVSQIFGAVPIDRETTVQITDRLIRVLPSNNTFERGSITGYPIGLEVKADGTIIFGSAVLPHGMELRREGDLA